MSPHTVRWWKQWLKSAAWRRRAERQLAAHPRCYRCAEPATIAEHVTEHGGNPTAFWHGDLRSACDAHATPEPHRAPSPRQVQPLDDDGWPRGDLKS